jgi:hypothetical protein
MKVYFQVTGYGSGKNGNCHDITAFVKPTRDGHGHYYSVDGKLKKFAWCDSKRAKCVDSSKLPKDLWYSFRHGTWNFSQLAKEGELDLENTDIRITDLEYEKVSSKQVAMYKKAKKAADDIKNIEELKAFYPQIKELKWIPGSFVRKVLNLADQKPAPAIKGELGFAHFCTWLRYSAAIKALDLE